MKIFKYLLLVCVLVITVTTCRDGTDAEVYFVQANEAKGFNYGYYYYIPQSIKNTSKKYLLVEPNNTGMFTNYDIDDIEIHSSAAQKMLDGAKDIANELGCVLLVPVIPRPWSNPPNTIEPQVLNRIAIKTTSGKHARVDLQLIKMIEDAKAICESMGIKLELKILIEGFSAGGVFGNRFTALHPELVQAVASGGINYKPILPINTKEGEEVIYPVGIADFQEITGAPFNLAEYIKVPQFIYVGAEDTNPGPYDNDDERNLVMKVLGGDSKERWESAKLIYEEQGCSAITYKMYPGVGHTATRQMRRDVINFLKANIK